MSNVYDFPREEEVFDDAFLDEFEPGEDQDAEAARRRPRFRGPIRTPQRGGAVPPRPAAGFATRAELTATANRLDAKIGQVSTGIKALDGRVRTLDSEQSKLRTALAAETKKREALVGQVNNLQQMSMRMPLLTSQDTVTTTLNGTSQNVVVDNGDSLARALPILMFAGSGTNTGQSGSSGGMFGDNNAMMMVALVMAMQKK
jgi:hypothetical protein